MGTCRKCQQPLKALLGGGTDGIFGTCSSCLKAKQQEQIRAQMQPVEGPFAMKKGIRTRARHDYYGTISVLDPIETEGKCKPFEEDLQQKIKCMGTGLPNMLRNTEETRLKIRDEIVKALSWEFKVLDCRYDPKAQTVTCLLCISPPKTPNWLTLSIDGGSELGD